MQKNNFKKVRFNGFGGIDTRKSKSGETCVYDINNFRVCDNGAVVGRSGYECIFEGSSNIRDIWTGTLNGEFTCIYLTSGNVYSLDLETGTSTYIMSIYSLTGPAQFFYYKDSLYLSDSQDLYKVGPTSYNRPVGYVPLYGKDWPTTYPGEINEPLNILNSFARISYLVPDDFTAMLPTKIPVEFIYSIYKNGTLVSSDQYSYDSALKVISVANLKPGDRLIVNLLISKDTDENKLLTCPYATVFGAVDNSRVLFWDPDESSVFSSVYVPPEDVAECSKYFSNCNDLYFPEGHNFIVGEGKYGLRGVARHYDRMLIFTEGDAWMANTAITGAEDFPVMNINTSVGCASTLGAITVKNSPFTIGKRDIFQWSSDTDKLDDCNAFSISRPINDLLPSNFFENAIIFKDDYRNEIWVHNPNVSNNAWIYNINNKAWVRFSRIHANKFFDSNGNVGFIYQKKIYVFKDNLYTDESKTIESSITTGRLAFDSKTSKRLSGFSLDTDTPNASIEMKLITDQGEEITSSITPMAPKAFKIKRLNSGRFFFIDNVVIKANRMTNRQIRSLEIYAR